MATIQRFNAPPNWPTPPAGWVPPQGWQPDPAWGPPPEGWQLWTTARANPRAWGYAFAFAGGCFLIFLGIGLALAASAGGVDPGGVAEVAGLIFARCAVAGLVTAVIAWVSRRRWAIWVYPLVVFGFCLVLAVIANAGQNATR